MPAATWSLAAAVVALLAVTVVVGGWAGLHQGRAAATATARAIVQLLLVAAVIRLIFATPPLTPAYLTVMVCAAAATSGRRLRTAGGLGSRGPSSRGPSSRGPSSWGPSSWGPFVAAGTAILAGAATTATVVFATGALPWSTRSVVPFVAQVIGGAMTATTLAGQRLIDDTVTSWAEVEGWLALGATPAQAVVDLGRRAAGRALVPALDQTRNVGLVVLPGAYVGLLLGGASPLEAARVQLLVLIGLVAAQTVAAVAVTTTLGRSLGRVRPDPESGLTRVRPDAGPA